MGGVVALALLITLLSSSAHAERFSLACFEEGVESAAESADHAGYDEAECAGGAVVDPCDRGIIDGGEPRDSGEEIDLESLSEDCATDPPTTVCSNVADHVTWTLANNLAVGEICIGPAVDVPGCIEWRPDAPTLGACSQSDAYGVSEDRGPP